MTSGSKTFSSAKPSSPVEAHDDAYPLVRIAGHANGGNTPVPVRGFQTYLRPGSKVSRTTNGFFVSPPRSRRRHAPSGTRSTWECGELSKRLRKRAIEVPYALTTRHLRHLCIKEPVAHPGAACSEKEVTRIEEAEASEGVHDLIRRLGSLNSGAEPRRKYTATSHGRTNSPRQAVYSQDCPVHVQASCSAPHPKKVGPSGPSPCGPRMDGATCVRRLLPSPSRRSMNHHQMHLDSAVSPLAQTCQRLSERSKRLRTSGVLIGPSKTAGRAHAN